MTRFRLSEQTCHSATFKKKFVYYFFKNFFIQLWNSALSSSWMTIPSRSGFSTRLSLFFVDYNWLYILIPLNSPCPFPISLLDFLTCSVGYQAWIKGDHAWCWPDQRKYHWTIIFQVSSVRDCAKLLPVLSYFFAPDRCWRMNGKISQISWSVVSDELVKQSPQVWVNATDSGDTRKLTNKSIEK